MTISELVFDFSGRNQARFRNDITVSMSAAGAPDDLSFAMATDEGHYMGGDDTAPPPLAHFATALAGCMMTQLRDCGRRLDIDLGRIDVRGRITWHAETKGRAPYLAAPGGIHLEIELESAASADDQQRLVNAARTACFVEQTILNGDDITHALVIDGTATPLP